MREPLREWFRATLPSGALATAWTASATRDGLILRGTALQAGAMATMAWTDHVWVAVPAMLLGGAAWITSVNTLEDDLTPRRIFPALQIKEPPPRGHVMVTIEPPDTAMEPTARRAADGRAAVRRETSG